MNEPIDIFFYCHIFVNSMPQERIQVSARISKELYDACIQQYGNITNAINTGLELSLKDNCPTSENSCPTFENTSETGVQFNEARIEDLKIHINTLNEQIKVKDENQQNRISDLKEQIISLNEQIKVKDGQIEKLNENMHGQVANIYNLTKDTKLLPETTSAKKQWWKFW